MTKPTIKIDVTQDDIENGEPLRADRCPVNLAAERAFGVPCRTNRMLIVVDSTDHCATLPTRAQDFIYNFDLRRWDHPDIEPFSFEVEDPRT